MHPLLRHLAILSLALTSACSTVVEGSSQSITVSSSPEGAQCFIEQAGDIVGRVTTPGTITIGKSKNDLIISCSKDGYESVTTKNRSDLAITSFGNIAFYQLSFLGSAVDSATGAGNKYDSKVFVTLTPAATPLAFPALPGAHPATQLPLQSAQGMSMQAPMPGQPATPEPVANVASTQPPAASASNPAIHAAVAMARATARLLERQQVAQLTYAQETAEAAHRPPFEITQ